jgi:hypothetical protein
MFPILANEVVIMVGQQTIGNGDQAQRPTIGLHFAQHEEVVLLLAKDGNAMRPAVVNVVKMPRKIFWPFGWHNTPPRCNAL